MPALFAMNLDALVRFCSVSRTASSLPNLPAASKSPGTIGGSTKTTPVSLTKRWPTIIQSSAGSGVDHLKTPSLMGVNMVPTSSPAGRHQVINLSGGANHSTGRTTGELFFWADHLDSFNDTRSFGTIC